jgi:cysteine desulfurase family protein (TIGR01976 family)
MTEFDVAAVRCRFTALELPYVFFDGPSGTQTPDEVVQALPRHLLERNANMGSRYETSRRTTALYEEARATAARFFECSDREVVFGANMTSLNFTLSRTVGRTLRAGDEVVLTQLEHDSNVAPWLELAHDTGIVVRFARVTPDGTLDVDHLANLVSERTRVVAFAWAANSIGTVVDAERVCAIAHEAGALAWIDAVHYAAHAPVDVLRVGADIALCSTYKFCGPHLGVAYVRAEVAESWRPYRVRPAPLEPLGHRFESGTPQYELLAGFVKTIEYLESIGGPRVFSEHEAELGRRFLDSLPDEYELHGPATMDGRVPTFAFNHRGRTATDVADVLAERGINAGAGNYYAPELMQALGIAAAVRIGISHYNTAEEVDLLLAALADVPAQSD